MKYVIVFAIILAAYSFSKCYALLTTGVSSGFFQAIYCRVSFLHFIPRRFSPIDFVVHLFLWFVVAILVWRLYVKYIKGRFF